MIKSVNRIPVLRYGLVVLLVFVLFSEAFYLYLHYNNTRKLEANISKLITAHQNSELIDSCLLNLYTADNNSRLFALTGDKKYISQFYNQLNNLNALLDKLKSVNPEINSGSDKLKVLISEKTSKTNSYVWLKRLTDSLIRSSLKADSSLAFKKVKIAIPVTQTVKTTVHYDTVKADLASTAPTHKKFLGRVFSAITSKGNNQSAAQPSALIVKKDTQINTITQAGTFYTMLPKKTRDYYRSLYKANSKMRSNEHDILLINNQLVVDIASKLKQYKTVELALATQNNAKLAGGVTDVFKEYNYLSKLMLGALIVMFVIVLYNVWKIFINDREIIDESEKARQYADNKSRFMASMSHEIRTPLNSVIGFSEQLGMSKLASEQTEQINAIRNSSHMLLDVVNEILDFSKYETGKMSFENQPFMLHKALYDVLNSVHIQAAKKGIILKRDLRFDKQLCLSGDVLRLKQVVMNLMVNAIKFTPTGEITLQAMVIVRPDGKNILKMRVKDTGIGIKKQDLPMIFDEFSQVDDAQKITRHKGTGLGLAICKKIVELQGGRIKAISEKGKGSVFSFELPFAAANKADLIMDDPISPTELIKKVAGAHVLLAEDNQLNVLLAKTILKKWKITCDIAYNGQEAFELFEKNNYDMVLTDIQMPIMGGLELLALIRQSHNTLKAETPVIALTANVLKEDRDTYRNAGADEIVLKPFVERSLIEKISLLLRTKYSNMDNLSFRYG